MAQEVAVPLGRFSEPRHRDDDDNDDNDGDDDDDDDGGGGGGGGGGNGEDDGRPVNPRPRKRRRLGCLPTATSRSSLPRQRRCLRNTKTTSSQLYSLCQSRKKELPPSERMPLARRCSAMSLPPFSPPTSPPRRAAAQPSTPPVQTSKALSAEKAKRPPASLRKLLPKIGFSWPVRETRNRHSRKLERRLAGLEGRERRALLHAFGAGANELDKKVVERGLVSVFEAGLGVLKGEGMKMRSLEDQSLFWEEVIAHQPEAWFGRVTGKVLHGLVLMTVEARFWDREHGVKIGWMNSARGRSELVRVVDEFTAWLEENEDGQTRKEYFGGIEGAVHVDLLADERTEQGRSILEEFSARYGVEDMDVYVDFDEQLAEELGDLMARLAIDADEEMVDVDWEQDWEGWSEGGIL
ncbi:hypothetical protein QC762_503955 [Podospora pseudocomata]|uniref:Uncharacterized protein n=1 Tax=Podospora pseudocomata TaxID=2093779 RepID=A0ABR0GB28_9PEZI|nr:hypothetical protein QC762_503955 [Podospora pseudocomata]